MEKESNNKNTVKGAYQKKLISSSEALGVVKKKAGGIVITLPTLIAWAKKNDFGRQIGRRWFIDKSALISYLAGDVKLKRRSVALKRREGK